MSPLKTFSLTKLIPSILYSYIPLPPSGVTVIVPVPFPQDGLVGIAVHPIGNGITTVAPQVDVQDASTTSLTVII